MKRILLVLLVALAFGCQEKTDVGCADLCGDGNCDEVVCQAEGCPCAETPESCPQDCAPKGTEDPSCVDQCGDGNCDEVVCQAEGCPCAETPESCPQDCGEENNMETDAELEAIREMNSKITSGYEYTLSQSGEQEDKLVYVLDDKKKIVYGLFKEHEGKPYNTVYVDGQEAIAVCEGDRVDCPNGSESISIEKPFILMPFDIYDSYPSMSYEKDQKLLGMETAVFDDGSAKIWIERFYGIPIKVEDGEDEIIFGDLDVNSVSEDDVSYE